MPRYSKELGREFDREAKNAAVAAHVLSLVTGPVGPLLVLMQTNEGQPFARFHATQAVLFGTIALPALIFSLGTAALLIVPLAAFAAMRASWGDWFAYPLLGRVTV
ncbi:MAG: hypothetical protein ACAI25_14480 [Planctomycetota bacterium]